MQAISESPVSCTHLVLVAASNSRFLCLCSFLSSSEVSIELCDFNVFRVCKFTYFIHRLSSGYLGQNDEVLHLGVIGRESQVSLIRHPKLVSLTIVLLQSQADSGALLNLSLRERYHSIRLVAEKMKARRLVKYVIAEVLPVN